MGLSPSLLRRAAPSLAGMTMGSEAGASPSPPEAGPPSMHLLMRTNMRISTRTLKRWNAAANSSPTTQSTNQSIHQNHPHILLHLIHCHPFVICLYRFLNFYIK